MRSPMKKTRKPPHPGVLFKRNFLDDRFIKVTFAADSLGIARKTLSEFVNGKSRCSPSMARRLSEATGTGVSVWLYLQAKLDIWEAENMAMPSGVTEI